jgi:hypothetical protein
MRPSIGRRAATCAIAVLAVSIALAGCASAAQAASATNEASAQAKPAAAAPAQVDAREVLWDPSVKADFEKDVPKFVRALAKSKMEDMAREKGTYLVDRALYEEAMATYKR